MSEIKRWLVKGPGNWCQYKNLRWSKRSDSEIAGDAHRKIREVLITRSPDMKGLTGTFYHWVEDSFHNTLKGRYTLAWILRHGQFELIVEASEDFMVEWKLIYGADVEIEEVFDIPERHRLILCDYDLLDDVPKGCNDLPYEARVKWHNKTMDSGKAMPLFGKDDDIVHNWTLQRTDSDFLKDDKYFISQKIINGLNETILEVFVTDSRFSEIMKHLPTASEIV